LEFVAAYTKSIDAAKELILYHLGEREIRWMCWQLEYSTSRVGRAHRFFWHPGNGRIEVDWVRSNATRTGPPWAVGKDPDPEIPKHPIFITNGPRITLKARLVRLNHDDVLTMLRNLGLIAPLAAEASPSAPTTAPAPIAAPTAPPELTDQPKLKPKEWFDAARRKHTRRKGEGAAAYADRLLERMKKAPVQRVWARTTMIRTINRRK